MKYILFFLSLCLWTVGCIPAQAQYSSQKEAAYIATLKAVADYKINDEENLKDVEKLRQDERFNKKLQKMLDQLSNKRSKDGKNRRIYNILQRAGKEIYDELS